MAPYVGAGSIRASSDAHGMVRFELPVSKGALPPFSIRTSQSRLDSTGGQRQVIMLDAIRLLASPKGVYELGMDLGELVLRFEPRAELHGYVTDVDGIPIAGAEVMVTTPGAGSHVGAPTDKAGAFAMAAPVREGSTVAVTVPGQDYVRQVKDLTGEPVEELGFTLKRGVSFYGRINVGNLRLPERAISIVLQHETEPDLYRYFWIDEAGAFEGGPVPPGDYAATVRHHGGQAMATFPGVHVGDSGRVTDERINGVRLMDHFRIVETTWSGTAQPYAPQYIVQPHHSSSPRSFVLIADLDNGLILPTQMGASVTFDSRGSQLRIEDVSTIGDTLHVEFGEPIGITLMVEGTPGPAKEYSLRGLPGSGAAGYAKTLPDGALRNGRVQVSVPTPGFYRVYVGEKPRPVAGGAMSLSTKTTPVGEPFEVMAPGLGSGDDGERQTLLVTL